MNVADMTDDEIDLLIDRLFKESHAKYDKLCRNPVTESGSVRGHDPIGPQKKAARKALHARRAFARIRPPDVPDLPLSHSEREELKVGGAPHIFAWYARSWEARDYDLEEHPSFQDYACGVMRSEFAPDFIKDDEELRRRFPPRPLKGLGPGLYWLPPALHANVMASYRRGLAA
jgi:hypothetical protein